MLSLLYSCSATKGLEDEDVLFSTLKVDIKDKKNITNKRQINSAIEYVSPQVNRPGILNFRTGFYNLYEETPPSGFKHTLKNKIGSKPKLFDYNLIETTQARLQKVMIDYGYFRAHVKCDSTIKKRNVTMTCDIEAGKRFKVDKVFWPYDSLKVTQAVDSFYNLTYVKPNQYYEKNHIESERNKLTQEAKNRGYIGFEKSNVLFYLDTLREEGNADIYVEFQPPSDSTSFERYVVGDIYIKSQTSFEGEERFEVTKDEKTGLSFLDKKYLLRPKVLDKFILLEKGKFLDEQNQRLTVNRLLDIGIYKFVNNKMVKRGDTLDQYYYLTPKSIKSVTGELELNNRSGNIFGTRGSIAFAHRNLFRGGEYFKIGLSGGIETQFGQESFINSNEYALEASLEFPRLVIPFVNAKTTRYFIPKTILSGLLKFESRINYFSLQNQQFKYGFRWKEDRNKTHEMYPLDFVNTYLISKTERFDSILNAPANIRLRESFEDLVILGVNYTFTYNNTPDAGSRNNLFFRGYVESSGNIYSLLSKNSIIFGTLASQFVKVTTDLRKYWSHGDNDIATRIYAGVGVPYGSSAQLPYSRQFSIGGASSLRAYRLRGLGPGTYDGNDKNQFIDQTGDVKLEANVEYRFPIVGFFKAAAFLDAGNIWLVKEGSTADQKFNFKNFYQQIAIGTGVGLRLDFDFFVLRFDLAFPLRGPSTDNGFEWKFKDIDPVKKAWRKDNLRLNLGIGYPF